MWLLRALRFRVELLWLQDVSDRHLGVSKDLPHLRPSLQHPASHVHVASASVGIWRQVGGSSGRVAMAIRCQ